MNRTAWSLLSWLLLPLVVVGAVLLAPAWLLAALARLAKAVARPWRICRLHARGFATVGPLYVRGNRRAPNRRKGRP
jgi:hypothetical protein